MNQEDYRGCLNFEWPFMEGCWDEYRPGEGYGWNLDDAYIVEDKWESEA